MFDYRVLRENSRKAAADAETFCDEMDRLYSERKDLCHTLFLAVAGIVPTPERGYDSPMAAAADVWNMRKRCEELQSALEQMDARK